MANEHPGEEDLVMLYYRESPGLRTHMECCPVCGAAYRDLARVLDACDDLPVPEPNPAFESRMWNRLEPQLHPLRRPFAKRWLALAAAAALLVLAFLAGRFTRPHGEVIAISADGRQQVLRIALGDHLERSEMVLTEVANGPDEAPDFAEERTRVRRLISDNRLYRQTAADAGDPALTQVLDDLERVLLDISHGTDQEEIKSRIESESLLFKLRVLGSNLNRVRGQSSAGTKEKL